MISSHYFVNCQIIINEDSFKNPPSFCCIKAEGMLQTHWAHSRNTCKQRRQAFLQASITKYSENFNGEHKPDGGHYVSWALIFLIICHSEYVYYKTISYLL